MVETRPKHYKVKADQLARIDTEIVEKIPDKKLLFISHEDLQTTISLPELTCIFCSEIANQATACSSCTFLFCKPCIEEYLKSGKTVCPVSGCGEQYVGKKPYPFCKRALDDLKVNCKMESCLERPSAIMI